MPKKIKPMVEVPIELVVQLKIRLNVDTCDSAGQLFSLWVDTGFRSVEEAREHHPQETYREVWFGVPRT